MGAFLAGAFFAVVFFAAILRGAAFLAVFFTAARFFTGPRARLSASSSYPRSGEICSGSSSLRRVALVSPSVT